MLTFTCLITSNIYVWLMVFFLFLSACGKGGGVLLFTVSPFGASSSGSGSTMLGCSTAGLGADGLTSLPLLDSCHSRVIRNQQNLYPILLLLP